MPPILPSGAMLELDLDLIDEGKLRKQIDNELRRVHRELRRYREETGDSSSKAELNVKVSLEYDKDVRDVVVLSHAVETKVPKRGGKTFVKEAGDMMLCQPTGSTKDDPDQQRLFDGKGNPIGTLDTSTGELLPPEHTIAGKVGVGT